ncbi:MAG TPA: AAA family ATPase [Halothiobacillus sp.]|nr:AAA family ATPase [Halothiobacillus sp.]
MKLIESVAIKGFRSIADEKAATLGSHTAFIGKNSSGKSNILRALNLYFNGRPSPGTSLELDRDVHYRPLRRQKKEINIVVNFNIPEGFKFRKELDRLEKLGRNFSISKTWSLNPQRRVEETISMSVNGVLVAGGDQLAKDFLALIIFRYIPNRTIPAEMLKDESQAIAGFIFRKLREATQAADVLKGISDSAAKLLTSTSEALADSGAPILEPNVATGDSLGDMLRMSGFRAKGMNGVEVRDEDWGSGHQAFFLLNLLREIDTDYSRQFGWRQASIWAVEEPESGLHHDLQSKLARKLIDWSSDQHRRLQIFTTTHSPIIAMSADTGYWVEIEETTSALKEMNVTELVRAAEERGVSSYTHPILSFPFHPVVVVEGKNDEIVLNHVARISGRGILKFTSLPGVDSDEGSGIDGIISYLKKNSSLITRRSLDAPLIVLADWEVGSEKMISLRKAYGKYSDRYVIKCNDANCSAQLDKSFVGLERFYPSSVIKRAHDEGVCSVAFPKDGGLWSIEKNQLNKCKARLANMVLEINDIRKLSSLVHIVEQVYEASVAKATEQMKLL